METVGGLGGVWRGREAALSQALPGQLPLNLKTEGDEMEIRSSYSTGFRRFFWEMVDGKVSILIF